MRDAAVCDRAGMGTRSQCDGYSFGALSGEVVSSVDRNWTDTIIVGCVRFAFMDLGLMVGNWQ